METILAASEPRRRGAWRCPLAIPASLFSDVFDSGVEIETVDLSSAGLFLASPLLLHAGERVLVSFVVPETAHRVLIDAQVVRTAHAGAVGMGLAFGKLLGTDERVLRDALERRRRALPEVTE